MTEKTLMYFLTFIGLYFELAGAFFLSVEAIGADHLNKIEKTIGILLTSGVVINGIFGFIGIQPLMGLGAVLILVSVLMSFIGIIQNTNK